MSAPLTNRDMHLLARLVLEPRAAVVDPAAFQKLIQAAYATRSLSGRAVIGMVTDRGVAALDAWLGFDAFPDVEVGLTPLQARVLQAISDRIASTGACPSRRVIARDCGLVISHVQVVIETLERRGRLRRIKGQARSLSVVPPLRPQANDVRGVSASAGLT